MVRGSTLSRRWLEQGVPRVLPAWLTEAREHLRTHHPAEGLAESVLWELHGAGFDLPPAPDSNEDVLEPLRRVVCP